MKKSILFVCTGNIFRSLSAERSFKHYLAQNNISGWTVGSAGTTAMHEDVHPATSRSLANLGIDTKGHKQRRLTRKMIDDHDIVIAMAHDHVDFIRRNFGTNKAILFNSLAAGQDLSVNDIQDEIDDLSDLNRVEAMIERTVKHVFNCTPAIFKNANERFYLFSDFVNGKLVHRNGYPFIRLLERKHSLAFMSIDIPEKEDGHILVIPKKRYSDLADMPKNVLSDLIFTVRKVGCALTANHGGYNVLLNNGADAGQVYFHSHFHVIPRNYDDGIRLEQWNHKEISADDFVRLNDRLYEQINGHSRNELDSSKNINN